MSIAWNEKAEKMMDGFHQAGEVDFEGAVLRTYDRYIGHDRYRDYADVWTGDGVRSIPVGGAYCTQNYAYAAVTVDATEEIQALAAEWEAKANRKASRINAAKDGVASAITIRKGRALEVYKGRKVAIGTRGVCIWVGDSQYGKRVGIKDDCDVVHWTALSNVRIVDGELEAAKQRLAEAKAAPLE